LYGQPQDAKDMLEVSTRDIMISDVSTSRLAISIIQVGPHAVGSATVQRNTIAKSRQAARKAHSASICGHACQSQIDLSHQ